MSYKNENVYKIQEIINADHRYAIEELAQSTKSTFSKWSQNLKMKSIATKHILRWQIY